MKLIKISFLPVLLSVVIAGCSVNKKNEDVVGIKAFNNLYVTVPGDTNGLKLIASKKEVGDWEKFILIHSTDGKTVSLKANSNCFVCANYVGGSFLTADKRNASSWETFTFEDLGNNQIAIKTSNGLYVSADQKLGGLLIANRDKPSDWEKFTIVKNP